MILRSVLLFVLVCLAFSKMAFAQDASPTATVGSTTSFDPVRATQAWLDTVPAEQRAKANAYFEGGYWLLLWDFLVTAAIAIFLLASKFSAQLRDFAER